RQARQWLFGVTCPLSWGAMPRARDGGTSGTVRLAPWFCFLAPARIRSMAMLLDRFQARVAAWSLTGLILTALVAALALLAFNESVMSADRIAAYGIFAIAVVVYAWVGRLITVRVPGNVIGWLLCLVGLSLAVSLLAEQYALRGLATSPGSLPAARSAGTIAWAAALVALTS